MTLSFKNCDFQQLKELVTILRNRIIVLETENNIQSNQIEELKSLMTNLENNTNTILTQLEFLTIIDTLFSSFTDLETNSLFGLINSDFHYSNDNYQKLAFYFAYNEPSIFINLVLSVLFQLFITDDRQINFQGANSVVTYFAVNIFPISSIYKNIPYYQYPNTNYWTVISIDTTGNWTDKVKYFSFTPYIGQYEENNIKTDYLANCNYSITSTLLKANNPEIFSTDKGKVYILYTFNRVFSTLFHNPRKGRYSVLLPDMISSSTFTIITRMEKKLSLQTINFTNKIRAFTFSDYPNFLSQFETDSNIEIATKEYVENELNNVPIIHSNYGTLNGNTYNVDNFIATVKDYNDNVDYTPLKIYPYFYLSNNNVVVTDVYQLIHSNSTCNALINDFNKNYYNSEAITIRDEQGNLLYSKFIILALNHVLSGYATSTNIQIYNVDTQKSIQTYSTSSDLPVLSNEKSPSNTFSVSQDQGLYVIEIDTSTSSFLDGVNKIAFFERVGYPIAFKQNLTFVNSGPRYSSFTYDENNPSPNPSESCSKNDVEANNIYNIQTNSPEFSLHLNYCPYSTLNFRVFYQ